MPQNFLLKKAALHLSFGEPVLPQVFGQRLPTLLLCATWRRFGRHAVREVAPTLAGGRTLLSQLF